jgi:hypothetical protein
LRNSSGFSDAQNVSNSYADGYVLKALAGITSSMSEG